MVLSWLRDGSSDCLEASGMLGERGLFGEVDEESTGLGLDRGFFLGVVRQGEEEEEVDGETRIMI